MTDQNDENDHERRLFDVCLEYQKEWQVIRYALNLIPDHEERIRKNEVLIHELKAKMMILDELPRLIKSNVTEHLSGVNAKLSEIKTDQALIKAQQKIFIDDKKLTSKLLITLATIGTLTVVVAFGQLAVVKFLEIVTGIF